MAGSSPRVSWSDPKAPTTNRAGSNPEARSLARAPSSRLPVNKPSVTSSRASSTFEQLTYPRIETCRVGRVLQLAIQALEIAFHDGRHTIIDRLVTVSVRSHEIADDLAVGLPVEPVVVGTRGAKNIAQRSMDGPTTGS